MNKLLSHALLAVALCGLSAPASFAGCFGLIPHHRCCGCCCCTKICCRQYNAFTPCCCGTLCCTGCCGPCGGGPGPMPCGPGPMPCGGGGCDGVAMGDMPVMASPDGVVAPPAGNPLVTPSPLPNRMPAGPTSAMNNSMAYAGYGYPVQPAAYRTAYYGGNYPAGPYPAYYANPYGYQAGYYQPPVVPQAMEVPSYWYDR